MPAEIHFPSSPQSLTPIQNPESDSTSTEPKVSGIFNRSISCLNSSLCLSTLAVITFSAIIPTVNAQDKEQGINGVETLNLVIAGLAFTFAVGGWITAKRSTNVARRSHEAAVMANNISEDQYYPNPLKGLLTQQVKEFIEEKAEVEALKSDSTLCISHRRLYRWYFEWKAEKFVSLKNHALQLSLEYLQKDGVSKQDLDALLASSIQKGLVLQSSEKKSKLNTLRITPEFLLQEIQLSLELLNGESDIQIEVRP